jgi:hypothetical protein
MVAADASGAAGDRCQSGYAGGAVRVADHGHVSADGGEEFRCGQWAEAGHAEQNPCLVVFTEPGFDLLVDFGDFLMQVRHGAGDTGDDVSTDFLGLDGGALWLSGA